MPIKDIEQRREWMREYMGTLMQTRRQGYIESQGNKCNYCCATDVPFDIDHIDRTQKKYDVSRLWTRSRELLESELAKCQVLCKPCHKAKTRHELMNHHVEHGTSTMYMRRSCRCDKCKAWNANRVKAQRAKAKADNNG